MKYATVITHFLSETVGEYQVYPGKTGRRSRPILSWKFLRDNQDPDRAFQGVEMILREEMGRTIYQAIGPMPLTGQLYGEK